MSELIQKHDSIKQQYLIFLSLYISELHLKVIS